MCLPMEMPSKTLQDFLGQTGQTGMLSPLRRLLAGNFYHRPVLSLRKGLAPQQNTHMPTCQKHMLCFPVCRCVHTYTCANK